MESPQNSYPFLEYAAAYWTSHTVDFRKDKSRTWDLFLRIVSDDSIPAIRPWEARQHDFSLLYWSQDTRHYGLFRHAISVFQTYQHPIGLAFLHAAAVGDSESIAIALPAIIAAIGVGFVSPHAESPTYCLQVALKLASSKGHIKVLERLVKTPLDLNLATALLVASENGYLEVVELLLKYNVKINDIVVSDEGISLDMLIPNIEPAGNVGWRVFQTACQLGDIEVALRLLAVNRDFVYEKGGRAVFQAACQHSHLEVVEQLLAANAGVTAASRLKGGRTALQAACASGHVEIVERLLDAGADVNVVMETGQTLLQSVCETGRIELVGLLLNAGAEVNARLDTGKTVLWDACKEAHVELVELLLDAGADPNAVMDIGQTALWPAFYGGHVKIVELMLGAGAGVNIPDGYNGYTVLAVGGSVTVYNGC